MRFNELIAGVRSDVAIKVFGEDSTHDGQTLPGKSRTYWTDIPGAADVKVEQTDGPAR